MNRVTKRVLLALLISSSIYLLYNTFLPSRKKEIVSSEKSITMEPNFSMEGTLVFLNLENDTIKQVELEIADNDQERTQGMMYRSSMSYDRAMLFIMEYERKQSFWMLNTKLSLDIIYINGNKEIVTIYKHTQPYSQSPIPSFKKAKYVVETTAGFCDKFGVKEGDYIDFSRLDS